MSHTIDKLEEYIKELEAKLEAIRTGGKERVQDIIEAARELGWTRPGDSQRNYPLMQLSEVEKCMLAMVDDTEFDRLREWMKNRRAAKESDKRGRTLEPEERE